jgi:hypothetical protein
MKINEAYSKACKKKELGDNRVVTIGAFKPNSPRGKCRSTQGRKDRIKSKHNMLSVPENINLNPHKQRQPQIYLEIMFLPHRNVMFLPFKCQ